MWGIGEPNNGGYTQCISVKLFTFTFRTENILTWNPIGTLHNWNDLNPNVSIGTNTYIIEYGIFPWVMNISATH